MSIKLLCSSYSLNSLAKVKELCEETYEQGCQLIPTALNEEGLLTSVGQLEPGTTWACWVSLFDLGEIEHFVTLLLGLTYSKKPKKLVVVLPQSRGNSLVHFQISSLIQHIQNAHCPTIVLECPLLLNDIFLNQELLERERLLMLPMGESTLSWINPQEVARQFTYHLVYSQVDMTIRMAEHIFLSGKAIANTLSELLAHPQGIEAWVRKRISCIDRNEDLQLDKEELQYYYLQLGWGRGEIEGWLKLTLNSKPYIKVEDSLHSLRPLLSFDAYGDSEPFLYLHLPPAYSFQEWESNSDVQELALSRAMEYWEGIRTYSPDREDIFSLRQLDQWLETELPHLHQTHILPGLGILKNVDTPTDDSLLILQEITLCSGFRFLRKMDERSGMLTYEFMEEGGGRSSWEWIHYEENLRSIALQEGKPVSISAEKEWKDWKTGLGLIFKQEELSEEQINQFRQQGKLPSFVVPAPRLSPLSSKGETFYFAGGTGIVAAMAMIRSRGNRTQTQPFHLEWAVKNRESLVFSKELEYWSSRMAEFSWSHAVTDEIGYMRAIQIQQGYPFSEGGMAYICGPKDYVIEVFAGLRAAGWPQSQIRRELFRALAHPEISKRIQAPDLAPQTNSYFSVKTHFPQT